MHFVVKDFLERICRHFQTDVQQNDQSSAKNEMQRRKKTNIPSVLPCTCTKKSSIIRNGIASHSDNRRSRENMQAIS